jgi:predicted ArsR family transcriptional regulator
MDLPAAGEEVLAQPTRARIFARLLEERAAVRTETLAGGLRLHPNGVRRHLERLREAGLVERRRSRGGRGRPGDLWAVAPGARPGGAPPRGYGDLARWLARAVGASAGRLKEVEAAGREIGREIAPEAGEPVEAFREAFSALGFQPALQADDRGGFNCSLGNCPYRDSAVENAELVCTLHRGLTAGLLEALEPRSKLLSFEPHDPDRAGCVIRVAGPPSA